jgi:hypothetical protein
VSGSSETKAGYEDLLKEITVLGLAEVVAQWTEYLYLNFLAYVGDSLKLVQQHRPRHLGTVRATLESWAEAQADVLGAAQARAQELALSGFAISDAVQHGDVRSRYGRTEVFLDDAWYVVYPIEQK